MRLYRNVSVVEAAAVSSFIFVLRVLVVLISRVVLILIFSPRQLRIPEVECVVAMIPAPSIDLSPVEANRVWPHEAVLLLLKMMGLLFPAWEGAHRLLLLPDEMAVQVVGEEGLLLLVMLGSVQR